MIPSSIPTMAIFDLIIIGLILITLGVSITQGLFKDRGKSVPGRLFLFLGLAVAGLYCLFDLLFIYAAYAWILDPQWLETIEILRPDLRAVTSLLSLSLISAGFVLLGIQRRRLEEEVIESESSAVTAREGAEKSAFQFNAMLEQTSDSIYCFEFRPPISIDLPVETQVSRSLDAVLVECNLAFAKSAGKASREEALGSRLCEMPTIMSPESHAIFHRKFIENGYRITDYRFNFVGADGKRHLFLVNASGDVEKGELVRLWGSDRNILEQANLRDTLAGRLKTQEFATRMSAKLLLAQADEIKEVLIRSLRDICAFMNVDRISIVWLDGDSRSAELRYFWNETGRRPWTSLSLDNFPLLGGKLLRGMPITVNSIEDLATVSSIDADRLAELGLKSVAAVPLVVAGKILGACTIGVVHDEREWSNFDISDLQSFAALIANVVFRINADSDLKRVVAELRGMKDRLEAENIYLREEIIQNNNFEELIGQSDSLRQSLHQVQQVAATDTAVLVQGETGTGKELIVRAIHQISDRSDRPLVKVNCAALPAELIESELFGHEKGAFTGAVSKKLGRFDLADGGTLFLDEIGDFPLELQGKLLRVLQEGEFQPVGGVETRKVNVRLIAATNRELQIAVDCGQFRADLYYRISVYPISLAPLRERDGDVRLLAEHFVHKHSPGLGKRITAISASMMAQLEAYSWPGNVRELESVIQRALISANGPILQMADKLGSGFESRQPEFSGAHVQTFDLLAVEKAHIERVLNQAGWVVAGGTGAAVKLGVPPSTLRSKMKKLGIHRPS